MALIESVPVLFGLGFGVGMVIGMVCLGAGLCWRAINIIT